MKKQLLIIVLMLALSTGLYAQMGVNSTGAAPNPSAMLDVSSTTKGLLIPRMTTAQKNAISPKPIGLMVYDITIASLQHWDGFNWSGGEWATVGNDVFKNTFGKVGINTTNLLNTFQIGSPTSPAFSGNDIAISNANGGGMSFFQSGAASTGNSIWYSNSSFALMPAYAGTGNVGINLNNPTSRLEVFQTGKTQAGFGSYVSPMRLGIGVTGSHAVVGDNYDAVGVAGFGANASNIKRNIGVLGTTGTSGYENIGVMGYQKGNFAILVYGSYNEVIQSGTGQPTSSYNKVTNSTNSTSFGVYAETTNTVASGAVSNFGVSSVVSSASGNASATNFGFYANATGSGTNYGLFASASGGTANYSIAAFGNSFFEDNVAIGATSIPALPLAKLVVTGFKGTSSGTSSYFNPGSAIYTNVSSGSNNSIYATHGIVSNLYIGAALSVIASDNRIKNIKGLSNSAEDLERLKKIQITDYTMKDENTWGNKTFKKVIAQQIEQVYPEVIKLQTSVIPDIYALAENVNYDATDKKLSVSMSKDYGIKIGDKIELVHPEKGKIQADVVEVLGKSFTVKDWEYATDKIFVFGREVNDFRSVDYEALSMLGISAIQQLAKEIENLKKSNSELNKINEKSETRFQALESALKTLLPSGK
jgi:Chaperone of endosialidase